MRAAFSLIPGVENMSTYIADTPSHGTLLRCSRSLVCLTFDASDTLVCYLARKQPGELTKIHNVVSTDSTVVDDDVPSPQSYSVPLGHH